MRVDLDYVRARWGQLRKRAAVQILRETCEARAVDEVWLEPRSLDYSPEPFAQESMQRIPSRRLAGFGPRGGRRVTLDERGRAVVVEETGSFPFLELLCWSDDGLVEQATIRGGQVDEFAVTAFDGPAPVERVSCRKAITRLDGKRAVDVSHYELDEHGRVALGFNVSESSDDPAYDGPCWSGGVTRYHYGGDGGLSLIDGASFGSFEHGQTFEAAMRETHDRWEAGEVELSTGWNARFLRREDELPDPAHAFDGVAVPMADAVREAVAVVRDRIGRLAFVTLFFHPIPRWDGQLIGHAAAAGVAYRDRARDVVEEPDDIVRLAGDDAEGSANLDVIERCTPDVQRRIRAGLQALDHKTEDPYEWRERLISRLAADVATHLTSAPWPDADPACIAVVKLGGTCELDFADPTAAAHYARRLREFTKTLQPGQRQTEPLVRHQRDVRVSDRPTLAALLRQEGLAEDLCDELAVGARWAIQLEPSENGVSRIGGRPLLTPDATWPLRNTRPLMHLASIALDELPNVEGRELLPADGHLAFFVDPDNFVEPLEPGAADRDRIAIIHTPGSQAVHEHDPPSSARTIRRLLAEHRVTATTRLQLNFSYDRQASLDVLDRDVVRRLTEVINGPDAWQLFGTRSAFEDPVGPGQVLLFNCSDDATLDLRDAPSVAMFADATDIRDRRWERLTVWPTLD